MGMWFEASAAIVNMSEVKTLTLTNFQMKLLTSIAATTAIAITGVTMSSIEANAANMNCYGSSSFQSCTYSDWVNGQYVTCYGTITKYSENWNCY